MAIGGSGFAGWHPFDFSSRLRADRFYGQVLRSIDMKADGGDGRGDLRAESFERPVFSGDRGGNLARCRSSAVAEMGVWRRQDSGGMAKAAVGWPPAEAGDWGAERAHLAEAAKGGGAGGLQRIEKASAN